MKSRSILALAVLAVSLLPWAANAQGVPTVKEVDATYAADKKLCAEEADSGARMQCLRDAKEQHTKGVAAAKAQAPTAGKASAAPACPDCGKVLGVQVVEKKGEGGALGLIAGGVVGGLLGNQVGGGRGNTLATIAGAAGGAYAGKKVEENVRSGNAWSVHVRFNDGQQNAYEFDHDPHFVAGDPVRRSGNTIAPR
jgi:outer membrane lipoprotein SlyB